jgi:hypothetical protein
MITSTFVGFTRMLSFAFNKLKEHPQIFRLLFSFFFGFMVHTNWSGYCESIEDLSEMDRLESFRRYLYYFELLLWLSIFASANGYGFARTYKIEGAPLSKWLNSNKLTDSSTSADV